MITIVGTLDNMCLAEALISQKLRQCVENDILQYQQAMAMYGVAVSTTGLPPPISPSVGGVPPVYPSPSAQGGGQGSAASLATYGSAPPPNAGSGGHRSASASGGQSSTNNSAGTTPQSSTSMHHIPGGSMPSYSPYTMPYLVNPYGGGGAVPIGAMPAGGMSPYWAMPQAASPAHQYPGSPYYAATAPYMSSPLSGGSLHGENVAKETVSIFVPNSVVGAIIGRGGNTIREMMNSSTATIKVKNTCFKSQAKFLIFIFFH